MMYTMVSLTRMRLFSVVVILASWAMVRWDTRGSPGLAASGFGFLLVGVLALDLDGRVHGFLLLAMVVVFAVAQRGMSSFG
jgi:hypothetical protein